MTPGQKIIEDAFAAYEAWERTYVEDLNEVEPTDRPAVYSYMMDGIDIDLAKAMVRIDNQPD